MEPATEAPAAPERKSKGADEKTDTTRARLIFDLPEGAKHFVDDRPIGNVAASKQLTTPPLKAGTNYYYEVRAEVTVDGEPVSETRRIVVTAGKVVREDFRTIRASATAKR
jgi:uncharacterized protein (TIGR03000 family)